MYTNEEIYKNSKIKNFKVNKDLLKMIAASSVTLTVLVGGSIYIKHSYNSFEKRIQDIEHPYKLADTFVDESGNILKIFNPGEHRITIIKNNVEYESESIDGYFIESVKNNVKNRKHLEMTYVNVEPVLVKATKIKGEDVYFNEFGSVQKENIRKK